MWSRRLISLSWLNTPSINVVSPALRRSRSAGRVTPAPLHCLIVSTVQSGRGFRTRSLQGGRNSTPIICSALSTRVVEAGMEPSAWKHVLALSDTHDTVQMFRCQEELDTEVLRSDTGEDKTLIYSEIPRFVIPRRRGFPALALASPPPNVIPRRGELSLWRERSTTRNLLFDRAHQRSPNNTISPKSCCATPSQHIP